jgi:hypothetical protein
MSGIDYENWKELKQYRDYVNIHTIPNPGRKWWQVWKPRRLPNKDVDYITFKFPDIEL